MPYWEITFAGKNSEDIQGIQLREAIRKIGSKMNLIGRVKNLKKSGKVKVILKAEDEPFVDEFCSMIISNDHSLIQGKIDEKYSKRKITFEPDPNWKDFKLIREDELTEMVWALQGAGKLIESQEKNQERTRKVSLIYNLNVISDLANKMGTKEINQKFILIAVENYVKEATEGDKDFIFLLYSLIQLCNQVNSYIDGVPSHAVIQKSEVKESLKQISDTCVQLFEKIQNNNNKE